MWQIFQNVILHISTFNHETAPNTKTRYPIENVSIDLHYAINKLLKTRNETIFLHKKATKLLNFWNDPRRSLFRDICTFKNAFSCAAFSLHFPFFSLFPIHTYTSPVLILSSTLKYNDNKTTGNFIKHRESPICTVHIRGRFFLSYKNTLNWKSLEFFIFYVFFFIMI